MVSFGGGFTWFDKLFEFNYARENICSSSSGIYLSIISNLSEHLGGSMCVRCAGAHS